MKYLLMFFLVWSVIATAGEPKSLKIGDSAPTFTLKNYDGKELSLEKALKEKSLTVLMFISTECPVSNGYNERMKKLYETYAKKGVNFIGINANKAEDMKAIAAHCKEHGFLFPVVKDVQNKIADAYGAMVTPETYVVNQKGKLMYHGRIDDNRTIEKVTSNDLADALEKLLAGKELAMTEARAFGCSIKRVDAD